MLSKHRRTLHICQVIRPVISQKLCLMHDTHLCQKYKYITRYNEKQAYITYLSIQKTRHQNLNSYRVTNSLMHNAVHTAESHDPVIQMK